MSSASTHQVSRLERPLATRTPSRPPEMFGRPPPRVATLPSEPIAAANATRNRNACRQTQYVTTSHYAQLIALPRPPSRPPARPPARPPTALYLVYTMHLPCFLIK